MKALVFLSCIVLVSLHVAGCNGCSSKPSGDTSYLDSDSNYPNGAETPSSISDNSIKIPYTEMYGNTSLFL